MHGRCDKCIHICLEDLKGEDHLEDLGTDEGYCTGSQRSMVEKQRLSSCGSG
jgi:hypothetical protein